MAGLLETIHGIFTERSKDMAFIGTVVATSGGKATLIRPGQRVADPQPYVVLNGTSYPAGTRVSVVQHGASWVVMGKL